MEDADFSVANEVARELLNRTDVNELTSCVGFLKECDSVDLFLEYLDVIIEDGRSVVRSGRTLGYYREIQKAVHHYLKPYFPDVQKMSVMLGWIARLMRYYAVAKPAYEHQQSSESVSRSVGVVKFFDTNRGFGFIRPAVGGKDVYVNHRDIVTGSLKSGDRVSYVVSPGRKGPQARDVKPE